MDRRGNRGDLEFLPRDRVTSPEIRRVLWTLMFWKLRIQEARVYLISHDLVSSVVQLPGYFDFVRKVFQRIRAGEISLIQLDVVQWKAWGFSGPVLSDLALLQGVVVQD